MHARMQRVTRNHVTMKCYGLGLGLDTFRMVALDANFRKLEEGHVTTSYATSATRAFFLDYHGTLTGCSTQPTMGLAPSEQVRVGDCVCLRAQSLPRVWGCGAALVCLWVCHCAGFMGFGETLTPACPAVFIRAVRVHVLAAHEPHARPHFPSPLHHTHTHTPHTQHTYTCHHARNPIVQACCKCRHPCPS